MYGEVTIACFIKKGTNTDMVWIWDKKQVSMGRRENYSTYSFALLLWRWKRSFELSHQGVWQDPFMQAEETEKWALGNYWQTEISWCLWNCSKVHSMKWDTVTMKNLLLKQWVENHGSIFQKIYPFFFLSPNLMKIGLPIPSFWISFCAFHLSHVT